ncbi:MAG: type II secretion system F family protein [Roseimicrobium sp.]
MAAFAYSAVNAAGKAVNGRMEAADESALEQKLQAIGFWLVSAKRQKDASTVFVKPISRRDMIDFYTLMSFQTKAGVSLIQAIKVAAGETQNIRLRIALKGVFQRIESGAMLFEALHEYPEAFSRQVVYMVRSGEMSCKLTETFVELRAYQEWLERIVADMRQATIYPLVVLSVISAFIGILFTVVVPKFAELLTQLNLPLPLVTKVVFGASDFAKATWWMWLIGLTVLIVGVRLGRKKSKAFATQYDWMLLKIPLFGELNRMIAMSRFTHNLAVMYNSGLPIIDALQLCEVVVGNRVVENAVRDVKLKVKAGIGLSIAMGRHKVFPAMVLKMVSLGEGTGSLYAALENAAEFYNEVIPRRMKKIFSLLEPIIMLCLVGLVATVAMAIFLPIMSMMHGFKR